MSSILRYFQIGSGGGAEWSRRLAGHSPYVGNLCGEIRGNARRRATDTDTGARTPEPAAAQILKGLGGDLPRTRLASSLARRIKDGVNLTRLRGPHDEPDTSVRFLVDLQVPPVRRKFLERNPRDLPLKGTVSDHSFAVVSVRRDQHEADKGWKCGGGRLRGGVHSSGKGLCDLPLFPYCSFRIFTERSPGKPLSVQSAPMARGQRGRRSFPRRTGEDADAQTAGAACGKSSPRRIR
jgi:hypothetical protein